MTKSFPRIACISICMFLFLSCKDDVAPDPLPEAFFGISENAKFSLNQDAYIAELADSVQFVNKSVNATSYEWDFGDGTFSNEKNPFHEFVETGNFTVVMSASNDKGDKATFERLFEIKKRILNSLAVLRIDVNRPDGTPWTELDFQRLILYFGEVDNPKKRYAFSIGTPPSGGLLNTRNFEIRLTDQDWFWMVIANRDPWDALDINDEIMFSTVVNATEIGESKLVERNGMAEINIGMDAVGETTNQFAIQIKWVLEGITR